MRTTVTKQQADWYTKAIRAAAIKAAKPAAVKTAAPRKPAAASRTGERQRLLDSAVRAGVINDGMRAHYARAYDADPEGTKLFLGKIGLKATGVQTGPPGNHTEAASGEPDAHGMDSFLTDAERARVAAVREGRRTTIVNGGL
jgi:hypothetical protein